MLFFVCSNEMDAIIKAERLKACGYKTKVAKKRKAPFISEMDYEVYGSLKSYRQTLAEKLTNNPIDWDEPTEEELKEIESKL